MPIGGSVAGYRNLDTFYVIQRDGSYVTQRDLNQVEDRRP